MPVAILAQTCMSESDEESELDFLGASVVVEHDGAGAGAGAGQHGQPAVVVVEHGAGAGAGAGQHGQPADLATADSDSEADSEADFLGAGAGQGAGAGAGQHGQPAVVVVEQVVVEHDGAGAGAGQHGQLAVVPAELGRRQAARSALHRELQGVHARRRSPLQHVAMTVHMRACKARKLHHNVLEAHKTAVVKLADSLRHQALRCSADVVVRAGRHAVPTLCITGGSHSNDKLSAYSWLAMAFDDLHVCDKALSRRYAVSAKTVRESLMCVAAMVLLLSSRLVSRMAHLAASSTATGTTMFFSMATLAWDETTRLLCMPLKPFSDQHRKGSWHVLVSQLVLDGIWQLHDSGRFAHGHSRVP